MRFSKFYQPNNRKGGRKPSQATIVKRNAEIEAERYRRRYNTFRHVSCGFGQYNRLFFQQRAQKMGEF